MEGYRVCEVFQSFVRTLRALRSTVAVNVIGPVSPGRAMGPVRAKTAMGTARSFTGRAGVIDRWDSMIDRWDQAIRLIDRLISGTKSD